MADKSDSLAPGDQDEENLYGTREEKLEIERLNITATYSKWLLIALFIWLSFSFALISVTLICTKTVNFPLVLFCTGPTLGLLTVIGTIANHSFRNPLSYQKSGKGDGHNSEIYQLVVKLIEQLGLKKD